MHMSGWVWVRFWGHVPRTVINSYNLQMSSRVIPSVAHTVGGHCIFPTYESGTTTQATFQIKL
jgi:hypothetical protein